jgi:hypothetical protein
MRFPRIVPEKRFSGEPLLEKPFISKDDPLVWME